jgi:hypothetical protein
MQTDAERSIALRTVHKRAAFYLQCLLFPVPLRRDFGWPGNNIFTLTPSSSYGSETTYL